MINPIDISSNVTSIYDGKSITDMLLEFEGILDDCHMYAYKNWEHGEVIAGPEVSRYWVEVTLMYPYKIMPDPAAAERLIERGCYVYYQQDKLITAVKLKNQNDIETELTDSNDDPLQQKVKSDIKIWLVKIVMPRHLISDYTSNTIEINGEEVNMADVNDAYDEELDGTQAHKEENQQPEEEDDELGL